MDEITINGEIYVKKEKMASENGKPYVICRTFSAGVFAGYMERREGKEVTLSNARRLWQWQGASSLSQLAMSGTSKPEQCKFPEPVAEVLLTECIELLCVSEKAKKIIQEVPVWKS